MILHPGLLHLAVGILLAHLLVASLPVSAGLLAAFALEHCMLVSSLLVHLIETSCLLAMLERHMLMSGLSSKDGFS